MSNPLAYMNLGILDKAKTSKQCTTVLLLPVNKISVTDKQITHTTPQWQRHKKTTSPRPCLEPSLLPRYTTKKPIVDNCTNDGWDLLAMWHSWSLVPFGNMRALMCRMPLIGPIPSSGGDATRCSDTATHNRLRQ